MCDQDSLHGFYAKQTEDEKLHEFPVIGKEHVIHVYSMLISTMIIEICTANLQTWTQSAP